MDSIKDLFKRKKSADQAKKPSSPQSDLAEMALRTINDGIVTTDHSGVIQSINPAAITMTECGSAEQAIGLDYALVIKLESKEGRELNEAENPLIQAMRTGRPLEPVQASLISTKSEKRIPVAISMLSTEGPSQNRIIVFRDITHELEAEGEQTEFISTASHEMRTPVATIDGYLSLALNPQTATIDERARGYLTAAEKASKHLGKLFQDLLDITKLDDGRIRPHFQPVEMVELVKSISDDYKMRGKEEKINYNFGPGNVEGFGDSHRMAQVVYGYVDVDFMREVLDNLIENAFKYTPAGGSIYVNVRGDGDRALINVTDTGIGISADDLTHIFQKFYRVDNSDTREIGGTGLGLYLVKQRVEAMGGRVWAESAFGEGSTFYVSLPRLSDAEYEKRMIAVRNQVLQPNPTAPAVTSVPATLTESVTSAIPAVPAATPEPAPAPVAPSPVAPAVPITPEPAPAPVAPAAPAAPESAPAPAVPEAPTAPAAPTEPTAPTIPTVPAAPEPVFAPVAPTSQPAQPQSTQPQPTSASPEPPGVTPPAPPATPPAPTPSTAQNQINNNLNGEIK